MKSNDVIVFSLGLSALFLSLTVNANTLSAEEKKNVTHIIQLFKSKDINAISQLIDYPLERENPIPAIHNANELKVRFHQVFDQKLIQTIAQSKHDQWSNMGWRGVMLDDGTIWLNDKKIRTVNYSGPAEQKYRQQLLNQQKSKLHPSIAEFKEPMLLFKTAHYVVRVDQLKNDQYRYASWKLGKTQSSKPDLVLTRGDITIDGSGGNHHYTFKSGAYAYIVYRNMIGTSDTPDVNLIVTKKDKEILNQQGQLIPYNASK